jgi:hypothetical protein
LHFAPTGGFELSLARCHQKVPTTVLAQVMLLMVVMLITPDRAGRGASQRRITDAWYGVLWSGWRDSNPRPPAPKAGALTKLRHIPCV